MRKIRRISALLLIFTLFTFTTSAVAQDTMQRTLRDSLYGGLIGALLGSAVLLLTDNPDDHLSYIPTGAAVGILAGAAYGVATSGLIQSAAEVDENGKLSFNMPTIATEKFYDEKLDEVEEIERIELVRVKF